MKYTVLVYESEPDEEVRYWAKVAELPGCYTTGQTIEEIEQNIKEAITVHLHGLSPDEIPPPAVRTLQVSVA
jgi:predicted RNase H-like HicB family nuclease